MTHTRNQDGFALIEVIVSAAVLAIVALAVLSGIDGATAVHRPREGPRRRRLARRAGPGAAALVPVRRARRPSPQADAGDGRRRHLHDQVRGAAGSPTTPTATPACGDAVRSRPSTCGSSTTVTSSDRRHAHHRRSRSSRWSRPSVAYAQDHGTLAVKVVDRNGVGVAGLTVTASTDGGDAPPRRPTRRLRALPLGPDRRPTRHAQHAGLRRQEGRRSSLETRTTVSPNYVNVVIDAPTTGRST